MKIYNRKEFIKLPEGTIFSSGPPLCFMNMCVKGESWETDFLKRSFSEIECSNSEENANRMYEMHEKGASYPISKSFAREGLFDEKMLYMVYEEEDLKYMIRLFENALKIKTEKS